MRGQAAMVPTGAAIADEGDTVVPDEPIPEVEAELDAADHVGFEAFLHAVRDMVHGGADATVPPAAQPVADPTVAEATEVAEVAEEDLGDWLPGVWEPAPASRRGRRRRRRQEAARAIAEAVPALDGTRPDDAPAAAPGPRRRLPRHEAAFARTITRAIARGESAPPRTEPETLLAYVARVDAPRLRRRYRRSRPRTPRWLRRAAVVTTVAAVVGACVAIPWVAPSVPQAISDLFPDGGSSSRVGDPAVAPPTDAFVGPIGVVQQAGPLAGVRLDAAGEPREVRVARLHVDSEVVPISGQSGTLLPPSDPLVLGWWQEGREVGAAEGTAVVTGHTVHTGGGALDQLDQLVVGDGVRVRTDRGWIRYVVQRTRIYSTDELARDAAQVFRLDGPGRLVLITCDDWNGSFYESNAVVVATPVEDLPTVSESETGVPDRGLVEDPLDPSGNMERRHDVVSVVPSA